MGRIRISIADRFWKKVCKTETCWLWTAAKQPNGYGVFGVLKNDVQSAHRYSLTLAGRDIPHGFTVDHLCKNRACVRPDHLEVVTMREKLRRGDGWSGINARKTHCPQGHPLVEGNLCREKYGRKCLICRRLRDMKRYVIKRSDPVYVRNLNKQNMRRYYENHELNLIKHREAARRFRQKHANNTAMH